jgi:MBG domain/MBG domain (YGX type)
MKFALSLTAWIATLLINGVFAADLVSPNWPVQIPYSINAQALDAQGNKYIVGSRGRVYSELTAVDYHPLVGMEDNLTPISDNDIIVTKIARDGSYAWSQILGSSLDDYASDIIVNNNTVYVCGSFSGPNFGIAAAGIGQGTNDCGFVVALDAQNGAAQLGFARSGVLTIDSSGDDWVTSMSMYQNNLLVTGTIGNQPLSINEPATPKSTFEYLRQSAAFVISLTSLTGTVNASFGTSGIVRIAGTAGITTSAIFQSSTDSTVYICGQFYSGSIAIDDNAAISFSSGTHGYVAAINSNNGTARAGFGTQGIQVITCTGDSSCASLTANDTTLFVGGWFDGTNLGIGELGLAQSIGGGDGYVAALNLQTGVGKNTFGGDGLRVIGGSYYEVAPNVHVNNAALFVAGTFASNNLGIDETGELGASGFYDSYVLALHGDTGNAIASFGHQGAIHISGSADDYLTLLESFESTLLIAGNSFSPDGHITQQATVGWDASSLWTGIMLSFDTVNGQSKQTLQFPEIPVQSLAQKSLTLSITPAPTGGTLSITSSNPKIASLNGTIITMHQSGTVNITAHQAATDSAPASTIVRQLIIITDEAPLSSPPSLRGNANYVAIDADGNRYITGTFSGAFDFNPNKPGFDPHVSKGETDVYVTRINKDGSYAWTKTLGSSLNDKPIGIAIRNNSVFIGGEFESFDFGFGQTGTIRNLGSNDLFIAALNRNTGLPVTAFNGNGIQRIGGSSTESAKAMTLFGATLYITGESWSPDIGIGVLGTHSTILGTLDIFIAAVSATSGAAVTTFSNDGIQGIGGTGYETALTIAADENNLIVFGRTSSSQLTIGANTINTPRVYDYSNSVFFTSLNRRTGALNTEFSGDGIEFIYTSSYYYPYNDIVLNAHQYNGSLYVCGSASSSLQIGSQPPVTIGPYSGRRGYIYACSMTNGNPVSTFGTNGILLIGTDGDQSVIDLLGHNDVLYAIGDTRSRVTGVFDSSISYIAALNPADGTLKSTFSDDGYQYIYHSSQYPSYYYYDTNDFNKRFDIAAYANEVVFLGVTKNDGYTEAIYSQVVNNTLGGYTENEWEWEINGEWPSYLLSLDATTGKQYQGLIIDPITDKTIVSPPFTVTVTPNGSGSPVLLSTSTPKLISIQDNTVTILAAGRATISATQSSGNGYASSTTSQSFTIIDDAWLEQPHIALTGDAKAMCHDAFGNYYVVGSFSGTKDFDSRRGRMDFHSAKGLTDVFITKFLSNGEYSWTKTIGGIDHETPMDIQHDNNVLYLTGNFTSPSLVIAGESNGIIRTNDANTIFVAAINAETGQALTTFGNHGLQRLGGAADDTVSALILADHLFVTGQFSSADFRIGDHGDTVEKYGNTSGFVAALVKGTGSPVSTFGTNGTVRIVSDKVVNLHALTIVNEHLYAGGKFTGTQCGIGGPGSIATQNDSVDGLIISLKTSTGAANSIFGTSGLCALKGDHTDTVDHLVTNGTAIFASGTFNSDNLGIGAVGTLSNRGLSNVFLAALSTTGNPMSGFGQHGLVLIGGTSVIACDDFLYAEGHLYVLGNARNSSVGFGSANTLFLDDFGDAFIACLSANTGAPQLSFSDDGLAHISSDYGNYEQSLIYRNSQLSLLANVRGGGIRIDLSSSIQSNDLFPQVIIPISTVSGLVFAQLEIYLPAQIGLIESEIPITVVSNPTGRPIIYTSSDPSIASVSGNVLTPRSAGWITITATQMATAEWGVTSTTVYTAIIDDYVDANWPNFLRHPVQLIASDHEGNRYLAGTYYQYTDFDPRKNHLDTLHDSYAVYITRINADGSYGWSQQIVSMNWYGDLRNMIIDDGFIYLASTFYGNSLRIGDSMPISSHGDNDIYVAKISAIDGAPALSFGQGGITRLGTSGSDDVGEIIIKNNNLFVGGSFSGTNFSINETTIFSPNDTAQESFIAALDKTTGQPISTFGIQGLVRISSTGNDTAESLCEYNNTLYLAGTFNSDGLGFGSSGTIPKIGQVSCFIAAVNAIDGTPQSNFGDQGLIKIGSTNLTRATHIRCDSSGLFLLGTFSGTDLGIGSLGTFAALGGEDVFIAALNATTGNPLASFASNGLLCIGGSGNDSSGKMQFYNNKIYLNGSYSSPSLGIATFGNLSLPARASTASFIAVINKALGSADTSFSNDGLERLFGDYYGTSLSDFSLFNDTLHLVGSTNGNGITWHTRYYHSSFYASGFALSVPANGTAPVSLSVTSTTVLADGHPHHAIINSSPSGIPLQVTYNGTTTVPSAVGSYVVQATSTDPDYPGNASGTLTIAKARLLVTPAHAWRRARASDPQFTYTISGFIDGDSTNIVTILPTFKSSATATSPAGRYPITGSGTIAPGYLVEHRAALLTIYDFDVTAIFLKGTAHGDVTPTVTVNAVPVPLTGGLWQADGHLGGDGPFDFLINVLGPIPSDRQQETIRIEVLDVPVGGG